MAEQIKIRHCATMEVFNRQVEIYPEYRRAQAAIESDTSLLLEKKQVIQT